MNEHVLNGEPAHEIPHRFLKPPQRGQRLFVDCDDTILSMWGDHELIRADGRRVTYRLQHAVIDFIHNWLAQERGEVIIWSLSSRQWAQEVVDNLLPSVKGDVLIWSRYPREALPGELYIDDAPFPSYRAACLNPQTLELWEPLEVGEEPA